MSWPRFAPGIAALLLACGPDPVATPPTPDLDPVERQAGLIVWIADPDRSATDAGVRALAAIQPTGLQIGDVPAHPGALADSIADSEALLAWAAAAEAELGASWPLGVDVAALAPDTVSVCFDPSDPTADPAVLGLRDALRALFDAHPEIDEVTLDPLAGAQFWEVSCTCTPCDAVDAAAQATRFALLFDVARAESAGRQRAIGWLHRAPELVALGAPEGAPTLPRAALDLALALVEEPLLPLRSASLRGLPSAFAPHDPRLDQALFRRVVGTIDAVGAVFGPTDALLLFPRAVHEQMRRERRKGVAAWVLRADGAGRTALDSLEEANLWVAARTFRDPNVDPVAVLAEFLAARLALSAKDAAPLAHALSDTGRALELATHPLGVPLADLHLGTPSSLPLRRLPVEELDPAWADRAASLGAPDLSVIVAAHQWASEAAIASADALDAVEQVADALASADLATLRRRSRTLDVAVRAFGLLNVADTTRNAQLVGLDDDRLDSWLRADADALAALADEVDDAVLAGLLDDPFPVLPENLRAVVTQLRSTLPAGPSTERDFPVLFHLRHDFGPGRTNYRWGVTPPAIGWVERGELLPIYLDASARGEGPANWWLAWTGGLAADTRVTWRACAEREDGLSVCSSDQALVSPL